MKNKDLIGLRYTIKRGEFKKMGYEFLHNKKGYILEIEKWAYTIWIWLAGKTIYVNDWYDRSLDVIECYKANRNANEYKSEDYIIIHMNYKSGFTALYSQKEFESLMDFKLFGKSSRKRIDDWKEKYQDCRKIYLEKKHMDRLIDEIEKLKPIHKYVGTPV